MRIYFTLLVLIIYNTSGFGQKQKDEPTSYQDDLILEWKKSNDTLKLVAKNKLLSSIEIIFKSKKTHNELKSFLLEPKDSLDLKIYIGSSQDSIYKSQFNDSIRVGYFWGHKSLINPDLAYQYRFPFKKGKSMK